MSLKLTAHNVPIARFDTSMIDPQDRYDAWHQNMGVLFDTYTSDRKILAPNIEAQINAGNLGEAVFGTTLGHTQMFERDGPRVARDGLDHIMVQLFVSGGAIANGEVKLSQGDIVVIDLDQPHRQVNSEFEVLTLVLPRELDAKLSEALAPLHGKRLDRKNPMVGLLSDHMQAFWRHIPDMNMVQAGAALHGTLGLMRNWLSYEHPLTDDGPPEMSTELGKVIRRHIEKNLSESLIPAELAKEFRISRTYMYRLFAPYGGVTAYISERRLRRSLRMLTQPVFTNLSIGTIGFTCGFSSESYFSRAFRARFGLTPTEARAIGADAIDPTGDPTGASSHELQLFPKWIRDLSDVAR